MFSFADTPKLPVIDLSLFDAGDPWRGHVAVQVDWAASAFGVFYLVGHEVDADSASLLLDYARRFVAPGAEVLVEEGAGLPDLPGLRDAARECITAMTGLGHKLTTTLARGLRLEDSYFVDRYTGWPRTLLRVRDTPAQWSPTRSTGLRAALTTDAGFLTLLKLEAGVTLRTPWGTGWIEAPERPGALLCALGPVVQQLTGGLYRAPELVPSVSGTPHGRVIQFSFDLRAGERTPLIRPEITQRHLIRTDFH